MRAAGSNKSFIFDHGFSPIPGWDLNVTWFSEEGLPRKGILAFEVFAGDGMNLLGCLVDKRLRNMLTPLVLAEQRDLREEVDGGAMLTEEHHMVFRRGFKTPVNDYPDVLRPGNHVRPTLPLLKLVTQREVFGRLGTLEASIEGGGEVGAEEGGALVRYTVDDANRHLAGTDVTWNYTSTIQKTDPWQML